MIRPRPSAPIRGKRARRSTSPGHPALAMMAGLSQGGLPLSVQFVGPYFGEAKLYQAARAWEREAGTAERHPPLA